MTRDDIIRLALEANILTPVDLLENNQWRQDTIRELERFAHLIAAAEREACAEVALAADDQGSVNQRLMQKRIAAAIRARGQQ